MDMPPQERAERPALAATAARGAAWITMARAFNYGSALLVTALLARLLTPAEFGVFAAALLVISVGIAVLDGAFAMGLVQREQIDRKAIGAAVVLSVLLGGLLAALAVAGADLIGGFFGSPGVAAPLMAMAILLPIQGPMAVHQALMQRQGRFRPIMVMSLVGNVAYGIIALVLAMQGAGVWALAWGQIGSTILQLGALQIAAPRGLSLAVNRGSLATALGEGMRFTPARVLNWASLNVDKVLMGRLGGDTELGLYSRASALVAAANQLLTFGASKALFPAFSRLQADRERMADGFERALMIAVLLLSFLSAYLVLFSDFVIAVLFGDDWSAITAPFVVLVFGLVARGGAVVAEAVTLGLGLGRANAIRQVLLLVLTTIGGVIGARAGPAGLALGVVVALWIYYIYLLGFVSRQVKLAGLRIVRAHLAPASLILIPCAAALGTMLLTERFGFWVSEIAGTLVFGGAALAMIAFAPPAFTGPDVARMRASVLRRAAKP